MTIVRRRMPSQIRIISGILEKGDQGIGGKELEKRTNLTRKTINTERDPLKAAGLIYYRRNGQRVRYFPGEKLKRNYHLYNNAIKEFFLHKLRSREIALSSSLYDTDFGKYSENRIERILFEFCMRLGISIMYILVQCVKPLNTRRFNLNESLTGYVGQINQILTEQWLNIVISPIDILTIFRQLLQHLGGRFISDSFGESALRYSYYSLDKNDFVLICRSLKNLFPEAHKQLSNIRLFENLSYFENKSTEYQKKIEHQKCSMGYKQETIQHGVRQFTCIQCDRIRRIPISKILKNKALIRKLNKLKPPTRNCTTHCWRLSKNDIPFAAFRCILCGTGALLQTESEEKLDLIKEHVQLDPRLIDLKKDVSLCRDIERFFHFNANRRLKLKTMWRSLKRSLIYKKVLESGCGLSVKYYQQTDIYNL